MPCLFFRNVPDGVEWDPEETDRLYRWVAEAAGVDPDKVEVHIESTKYQILRRDGTLDPNHGVHVFVEWHEGRGDMAEWRIARAIHHFLGCHGLGEGSDTAFRGYPVGSFYYEGIKVGDADPPVL